MIRRLFFLCAILPSALALPSAIASAAPLSQSVGRSAQVTLGVSPDPPRVGSNDFTVRVSGEPLSVLDHATVRFATVMPSMNMTGPQGFATRTSATAWRFSATLGMASQWAVQIAFTGALDGSATFRYDVGTSASTTTAITSKTQNAPIAGMSAGNPLPWETAFFALLILVIVGYFVLQRDRRPVVLALGAVAVVAIVVLAIAQSRYTAPTMDMTTMANVAGSAPVAVRTIRVGTQKESTQTVLAPGTVSPYLMQDVAARVSGILQDFTVYTGDRVRAGEQIAFLQASELGSTADAARAAAAAAEIEAAHHAPNDVRMAQNDIAAKQRAAQYWSQEITRERMLLREGAVSQQEYQDEVAQDASAQAALRNAVIKASDAAASVDQARAQYSQAASEAQTQATIASYRSITAPDDGVVVKRLVDPGSYVQAGTVIARIAVLDELRVQANVSQTDLPRVQVGDPLDATMADGSVVHGRVSSLSPVADPQTHTALVEAIVRNTGRAVQPGGFVNVRIYVGPRVQRGGIPVPAAAVLGGTMNPRIWIDRDGTAHSVAVRVLSNDGTTAIVSGAIPRGALIVTDGAALLIEGQAVTQASP